MSYGDVSIDVTYNQALVADDAERSMIVLHEKNLHLDLDTVTVTNSRGIAVDIAGFVFDYEREFLKILLADQLSSTLGQNTYTVSMSFQSYLDAGDLRGFYTSTYLDKATGVEKTLAVTQFEAIDARRAFPCFDEPDLKATFTVSLGRADNLFAASNMPFESSDEIPGRDGYTMDNFEKSEVMSTYLVAFFVGEYDQTLSNETDGYDWDFSILHQPSQADEIGVALESGVAILAGFEEYFQIPYALPKMDMVGIPDFYYGGMENWGLITYAEIYISYVEGDSSSSDMADVVEVVAHEVAHQWFGDLITMEWWEDIWLNEGEQFRKIP